MLTNPRKQTLSAQAPQHPRNPTVVMQQPAIISKNGELSIDMTSYGIANEVDDVPDAAATTEDDDSTDNGDVGRDEL